MLLCIIPEGEKSSISENIKCNIVKQPQRNDHFAVLIICLALKTKCRDSYTFFEEYKSNLLTIFRMINELYATVWFLQVIFATKPFGLGLTYIFYAFWCKCCLRSSCVGVERACLLCNYSTAQLCTWNWWQTRNTLAYTTIKYVITNTYSATILYLLITYLKGAQVWDFRSLGFSWFLPH